MLLIRWTPCSKLRIINDRKLLLFLNVFLQKQSDWWKNSWKFIDSHFRNWLVNSVSKIKSSHFHGYHFDANLGNYERHLTTFSWNLSGKTYTIWWKNRQFHLCPCKACVINDETKPSVSKKVFSLIEFWV